MNKIFVNNIGDLGEAQRASFYNFLYSGILKEFRSFPNPFLAKIRVFPKKRKLLCCVYLYLNEIKLKGPNVSLTHCLRRDISYTIQLYIPGEYTYRDPSQGKKKIRVKQDIFFGDIPLMTEEGSFVISGCERVIISQIIRSPGIYFRKEFGTTRKTMYTATIISDKGLWTKVILDEPKQKKKTKEEEELVTSDDYKERIYIKLNDFQSKYEESNEKKKKKDLEIDKLFLYDIIRYFGLNMQEVSDSLKHPLHLSNHQWSRKYGQEVTEQVKMKAEIELSHFIKKLFFNQRSGCFSIGEIGRYKVNKKLGLNLPKRVHQLTVQDFLAIIDGLIELKYYDRVSDDIDDIKNKQIRCVGELLQIQFRNGLHRLEKNIIAEPASVTNSQKVNFDLEAAYDPEDWILDPKPLTTSIKDFYKTSQLSQFMDQINPLAEMTHKRRISVFGPNGLKRDHISTVIRDIHPSQYGRLCPIETPEGQNAGLISSIALFARVGTFGSLETPYFFIDKSKVCSQKRPIFLNPQQEAETNIAFCDISMNEKGLIQEEYLSVKQNNLFLVKKSEDVPFMTTSPLQIVSLATSLIPFLEHNDANRALMGSNMQRQAVPLLYTQKPIVGTGLEIAAIVDSGMIVKSYCEGSVLFSCSNAIKIQDLSNQSIVYYLRKYYRSNQETSINQKPIVWHGEKVFSGQIIADGPSTNDGELSLGRNLTIAYMPWEGYNYEDAIVINEQIVIQDYLTSVHIEEHETNLSYWVTGSEKVTNDLAHLTKHVRRHLDADGIIKIGSYVREHDILVGKLTPCEEDSSPEANLLRALYSQKNEKNYRDTSLRVPHGTEGRVIDVRIISTALLNKEEPSLLNFCDIIRIYIAQIRKIHVGDKLAGRHGNKGIISRILSQQDMPYLPDGTPVDIIFNPLGVPSRMNVGQVFECLLGLAGEKLGSRFKICPFDEVYGKEASRVLVNQKLKEAAIKTNEKWIFNSYYPGKILLKDGRTGEYFDNPITVGKSYILKLIHLVEDKIHTRATGPYSMITEQPLAGKAQRGGQRFGEMEVWALEAFGCSNTLQEILTIKSDDIDGRNDMYESILVRRKKKKPTPSIPEAFLALIRELHALGLDFSLQKFENTFLATSKAQEKEKDIFSDLEKRLHIRALLERKKSERGTDIYTEKEKEKEKNKEKNKEKEKEEDKEKEKEKEKEKQKKEEEKRKKKQAWLAEKKKIIKRFLKFLELNEMERDE